MAVVKAVGGCSAAPDEARGTRMGLKCSSHWAARSPQGYDPLK